MINENIVGRCLRSRSSGGNPRISPLTPPYEYPPLLLLTSSRERQPALRFRGRKGRYSVRVVQALSRQQTLRFVHSNCVRFTSPRLATRRVHALHFPLAGHESEPPRQANARERLPTTSFLTATNLMFLHRAGITAAAGTRLALDSILARTFPPDPFRSPNPNGPEHGNPRHCLARGAWGNFRNCCNP